MLSLRAIKVWMNRPRKQKKAKPRVNLSQLPSSNEALGKFIEKLKETVSQFPDKRTGKNLTYEIGDAGLGAFSLFFMQSPSFLDFQRRMAEKQGSSNAQSLFGLHKIPTNNHIRGLMDEVPPEQLHPVFNQAFETFLASPHAQRYRVLNETFLIALDGTQYFSSEKISCENCSHRESAKGTHLYSHHMINPVVLAPGLAEVICLEPEFIVPQDGHAKQDCENAAAKRWFNGHGAKYHHLGVTYLGDDLYCHQPMCQQILEQGAHFLLVCKPSSHKFLTEWLQGLEHLGEVETLILRKWNGKQRLTHTYRFANQLPIRDGQDALLGNWCELTITNSQGEILYRNAWFTDHSVNSKNVEQIASAARARWKVENENFNVLKTKGYHLEHNFGHGKKYLASLMVTMNLLAFLLHTLLHLMDRKYKLLRERLSVRKVFFNDLKTLTRYLYFPSWDHLFDFMIESLEI